MSSSDTGGVKPMPIAGRMVRERERCMGMTPEDRKWRAQWLKDQVLSKNEPYDVPEYWKEIRNPIRRAYTAPLNTITTMLSPIIGHTNALYIRYFTGKFLLAAVGIYATAYYFKYNQNDWTRRGGWRVISSRPLSTPGRPDWLKPSDRTQMTDYANRGFKNSPI